MLPGMGGLEIVVVALIALVVIGPKDLPMFLRKLGRFTAKVRGMAEEFRNSFDELARQSELDELRREVEALRTQSMRPLGPDLDNHFREIGDHLSDAPTAWTAPVEGPSMHDVEPVAAPAPSGALPETPVRKRASRAAGAGAVKAAADVAPTGPRRKAAHSAGGKSAARPRKRTAAKPGASE